VLRVPDDFRAATLRRLVEALDDRAGELPASKFVLRRACGCSSRPSRAMGRKGAESLMVIRARRVRARSAERHLFIFFSRRCDSLFSTILP
jgi:hypothetical protein